MMQKHPVLPSFISHERSTPLQRSHSRKVSPGHIVDAGTWTYWNGAMGLGHVIEAGRHTHDEMTGLMWVYASSGLFCSGHGVGIECAMNVRSWVVERAG